MTKISKKSAHKAMGENTNYPAMPVINALNKAEIQIVPSEIRALKSYIRQCKKEIDEDERLIFNLYFEDDELESIYNRSFKKLLYLTLKPKKMIRASK